MICTETKILTVLNVINKDFNAYTEWKKVWKKIKNLLNLFHKTKKTKYMVNK